VPINTTGTVPVLAASNSSCENPGFGWVRRFAMMTDEKIDAVSH
jgi:hypothetical protein